MKKLLFDLSICQPIGNTPFHGGGIYGYIVFEHLVPLCEGNIVAYVNTEKFIPDNIKAIIAKHHVQIIDVKERSLYSIFEEKICDVLYSPLYREEYTKLFPLEVPIIVTIHGLRALEMNRDRYEYLYEDSLKEKLKAFIKQTPYFSVLHRKYLQRFKDILEYPHSTIITVSEHSKSSIRTFYPKVREESIYVRYSPSTTDPSSIYEGERTKNYYLIISANRWLKNAYRAMQALDYLYEEGLLEKPTYIVGIDKASGLFRRIRNRNKFVCHGYLDKFTLEKMFANAYALIYPTLNEGFGYPPLEAMKYGTPAIVSPLSSVPEICADAVIYTNPYSHMEIASRILQIEDPECHEYYSEKGYERHKAIAAKQESDLELLANDIISIFRNNIN